MTTTAPNVTPSAAERRQAETVDAILLAWARRHTPEPRWFQAGPLTPSERWYILAEQAKLARRG